MEQCYRQTGSAAPGPDPASLDLGVWDSNAHAQSQLGQCKAGADTPFLSAASLSADAVARAKGTADQLFRMVLDGTNTLLPGYVHARDALDSLAVAELGGRIVASVASIRGARSALGQMIAAIPHQSKVGAADTQQQVDLVGVEQRLPALDEFVARFEVHAYETLVPHTFQGAEVASGFAVSAAEPVPLEQLGQELTRTYQMLEAVGRIKKITGAPESLDQAELDDCRLRLRPDLLLQCRREIEGWASRPMDLLFVKAALGSAWHMVDLEPGKTGPQPSLGVLGAAKPSDLLAQAEENAQKTGWLGDTGRFDLGTMRVLCMGDDKEGGLFALRMLYSADRATRPVLLEQMAKQGFLDSFCDKLGSAAVETLYEDLPIEGHEEVKSQLAKHFEQGTCDVDEEASKTDLGELPVLLADADKQTSEFALDDLFEMNAEARTRAVEEMQRRGLLDPMLDSLGWAPIKQLHDSLAGGHGPIKKHLQPYFIGKGKYGPSLDSEWESHESSLYSLVNKIPYAGKALNTGLDFVTFGFNSSYGQARDAHTRGETSDSEYAHTRNHLFARTALMAGVSLLTGGAADKFARAAGAGATLAGAAGGMVGGVSGLATSDAYNVYVSGEQEGFSSFEDYVKTAVLGAGVGGVLGRVTEGLSKGSSKYLPPGSAGELPAGAGAGELPGVREPLALPPGSPEVVTPEVATPEVATPEVATPEVGGEAPGAAPDPAVARAMETYDALGAEPREIDIRVHDQEFANEEAHTSNRHDPDIPLERDPNTAATGPRTVEGRIYGDGPWSQGRPQNWSYKWLSEDLMNSTINQHVRANWEAIRSDLATTGEYSGSGEAGNAIGEGYFNPNQMGLGPRASTYGVTSRFRITILLRPGNPPTWYVVTAFPAPTAVVL